MSTLHSEPDVVDRAAARPTDGSPHLSFLRRRIVGVKLFWIRITDRIVFESSLYGRFVGVLGYASSLVLELFGSRKRAFNILSKLHRADYWRPATARAEKLARQGADGTDGAIAAVYESTIRDLGPTSNTAKFFANPERLLKHMIIVLKSSGANEKGVINLRYSYVYTLFCRLFDVNRIAEKYYIVLEPSWNGYCDLSLLAFTRYPFPVFVQTSEPRDRDFIEGLNANLVPIPGGANWWIDHRLFTPLGSKKDYDLVMNARWGKYKRHSHFFDALRKLRRGGHFLRTLLLGYPQDMTQGDIIRLAKYFGIDDQLELYDSVPYDQVGPLLARAKAHVVWSRKEGTNRAMIEGMLCGVPCVLREGFNYGHRYAHINSQTGCYADDNDLPSKLLWVLDNCERFSPRQWVLDHMSCQKASQVLSETLRQVATSNGEHWNSPLAVKVNRLHSMSYWNLEVEAQFVDDYSFLRSAIRS